MIQEEQKLKSLRERQLFYLNFNVMMFFITPIMFKSNYLSSKIFFGMNSCMWVWRLWIREWVTNKSEEAAFALDITLMIGYIIGFILVLYFAS